MMFNTYKIFPGFNNFILNANLPPSLKSLTLQIVWIWFLLQGTWWLLIFSFDQLIVLLNYIIFLLLVFIFTGDLTLVFKYIITDSTNLIYKIVQKILSYLNFLLSRQDIESYTDYIVFVMCSDYLFMVIIGVIVIKYFNKCFSQDESYNNYFILGFFIWLFYNLVCLVIGGVLYPNQDPMSHIANLRNVSMIITSLTYVIFRKLELFVTNECGDISLNLNLIKFESWVTFILNLFFVTYLAVLLVTLFYGYTEVHYLNNIKSGYIYPNMDLPSSYKWALTTFLVSPKLLLIQILAFLVYNVYYSYKIHSLISFYIKYKKDEKKTC